MTMMEEHFHNMAEDNTNAGHKAGNKESARHPFPVKVYEMLEDADAKNFAHIVSWNPPGDGFMVHKKDLFIYEIVPQYFNQTKYKSFQRQLSLYGFNRVTVGANKGLRHHEKLRRGRYDLVCQMKPVGYKPRGTTKLMQQQQDGMQPLTVASNAAAVPMLTYRPEVSPSSPMTVVGAHTTAEGIPTVISSISMDKLCTVSPDQVKAVLQQRHVDGHFASPGMVSEGEDSSSSDDAVGDEELQDLIERGLFEGMGFYLTMPVQPSITPAHQEFLPTPSLPLSQVDCVPLPPPSVMDVELKKAWQTGYSMALSIKTTGATPQGETTLGPMPPSPRLHLDDCVDALDFHAANIAATTGANL
jgi:HSF-type DNA-binding